MFYRQRLRIEDWKLGSGVWGLDAYLNDLHQALFISRIRRVSRALQRSLPLLLHGFLACTDASWHEFYQLHTGGFFVALHY